VSQGRAHTFASLREDIEFIEIPIIQRDYAQGRGEAADVRLNFLGALRDALRPEGLPLDLDFVYGSITVDGSRTLSVLDGQQRLTTLFLLHWYLAARENRLDDFQRNWWVDGRSRFSYATRPSSAEFFEALVSQGSLPAEDEARPLSEALADARWFFSAWRRDPTVHSCLVMLDAIHASFRTEPAGRYDVLMTQRQVSFHFLNLPAFGLSDDLYIKMNARGKPLTPFENFKAWLVERCAGEPWANEFELGMDQRWLDFFWDVAGRSGTDGAGGQVDFGDLFLRFFHLLAYFESCAALGDIRWPDPADRAWLDAIRSARGYVRLREFEARGLLEARNVPGIMRLLDFLADPRHPAARHTLIKALAAKADYQEYLRLHALVAFVQSVAFEELDEDARAAALHRWLRVTTNLICNSRIDDPLSAAAAVRGLTQLAKQSTQLYEYLSTTIPTQFGFTKEQTREEARKAALILHDAGWATAIEMAEKHWYLQGRVGFLLDIAATGPLTIDPARLLRSAQAMERAVTSETLDSAEHLLSRALLTLYDYLPKAGANHTLCTANATSFRDRLENWLRVFDDVRFATLLDDIDEDGPGSLRRLIAASTATDWRRYVIESPPLIDYCKFRLVHRKDSDLLLLSKSRLTGFFAEVRSLALHHELKRRSAAGTLPAVTVMAYLQVYEDKWPAVRILADREYLISYRDHKWNCVDANGQSQSPPESVLVAMHALQT
jgi:hypothetical protein